LYDAVRRQLDEDLETRAHHVAVMAADGVITLAGFVDSSAESLAAERSARRVLGVRAVANDIQTHPRDERTDPDIARDAVRALDSHTNVTHRVTVTVRHGFVTLDGVVEGMHQRAAAESAVKHIDGVRSVANLIQISQPLPNEPRGPLQA
jgi:osmotically-inducible protein OsmY